MAKWEKFIEWHYRKEDIVNVKVTASWINVKFNMISDRVGEFGCKVEIFPELDGYKKPMLRYEIYKIDDIKYFTEDNLKNYLNYFLLLTAITIGTTGITIDTINFMILKYLKEKVTG